MSSKDWTPLEMSTKDAPNPKEQDSRFYWALRAPYVATLFFGSGLIPPNIN